LKYLKRHAPPLIVLRSETESGRVALRLIGELDLGTVDLLEAALARTRDQPPPSVIDLSELRFLDLVGLRALLHAVGDDVAGLVRLVGATGIVHRLIELAQAVGAAPDGLACGPFPVEPTTTVAAEWADAHALRARSPDVIRGSPFGNEERA
jgi:anti-anti-sigma factor